MCKRLFKKWRQRKNMVETNDAVKIDAQDVKMSSPWVVYFRKLEALFQEDEAIQVVFDEDSYVIKLYVDGEAKSEALRQLLPNSVSFGNVTVDVDVIPANSLYESRMSLIKAAFEGNKAISYSTTVDVGSSNVFNYIVFEPKVVQYYNDDLGDINGLCSTLYQNLAKDIFGEQDGVYFCTDIINS